MNEEKNIIKITLHYKDGSTLETNKGFICSMTPSEEEEGCTEFVFSMCNISGSDLKIIVCGMIQLGDRLGMFQKAEESEYED